MRKIMLLAFCLGSLTAFAETVTLNAAMWVGGKELKAGDYNVKVLDGKVVFLQGKVEAAAVPVVIETLPQKNQYTSIHSAEQKISEILLGGTATKLVLQAAR